MSMPSYRPCMAKNPAGTNDGQRQHHQIIFLEGGQVSHHTARPGRTAVWHRRSSCPWVHDPFYYCIP